MQILVISDTHLTNPGELPAKLVDVARSSDCIVHAGDFTGLQIYEFLAEIGRLEAVRGNSDEPALRGILPVKRVVEIDSVKIGVIHGTGAPFGMARRAAAEFENVHAVIFGHAHRPVRDKVGGILVMNPGSPTSNRFLPSNTYGLLTINGGTVSGEIVEIATKQS
jgi:putative phosphoesterase